MMTVMMTETIREHTTIKETNNVTSKQVLCWPERLEVQRVEKALLEVTNETKESKEFDFLKRPLYKIIPYET